MATAAHTHTEVEERSHDHTPIWAWGLDLVGLLAAISPALIYIGYLLTQ